MTLHCGRCGGELNGWAICQPCRVVDAINASSKSGRTNFSDIQFPANAKTTVNGGITALIIFAICVGVPFAIIFWYVSLFFS